VSDLQREEGIRRLEDARAAAERALQTIERHIHLAKGDSEDSMRDLLATAERELEVALARLRGTLPDDQPGEPSAPGAAI
jgi:hypothetical protein